MTVYVITDRDSGTDSIDTPIFECGPHNQSAMAIFTEEAKGRSYLAEAGWEREQQLAELTSAEAAKLLIIAEEENVEYLAYDPQYQSQQPCEVIRLTDPPLEAHINLLKKSIHR